MVEEPVGSVVIRTGWGSFATDAVRPALRMTSSEDFRRRRDAGATKKPRRAAPFCFARDRPFGFAQDGRTSCKDVAGD